MSKKATPPPETLPNSADQEAERHVIEVMGPVWSKPSDVPIETVPPIEQSLPDTTPPTPEMPPVAEPPAPAEIQPQVAVDPVPDESADDSVLKAAFETPKIEEEIAETAVSEAVAEKATSTADKTEGDAPTSPVVMKESPIERFKEAFYRWWDNKVARYVTLGVLAVIIGVVVGVPAVRTGAMNLLGFRASVSVYAVDATTLQPLKGVTLSAGDGSVKTGENGKAKLTGVKLGTQTVKVHKAGFADVKQQITFGFRAVDLGEIDMKATGLQLGFVLTDYISGKPITDVMLESGESSTKSDKTGKAVITLAPDNTSDTISVHKSGYRTEQLKAAGEQGSVQDVKLILAAKEVYVAKENGIYNLREVDLDGQNDTMLLEGTGHENTSFDVSVDPASQYAAFVSTRDAIKDTDGYLLSALTLVNIGNSESKTIEHAENLTIVGWSGTTLVYKQVIAGTSAANANREKLMSYDYATAKRYQIASANQFLGTELYGGKLYYAVSSTDPSAKSGLMSATLTGSDKKLIKEADLWAMYRPNYKTIRLQTSSAWYDYVFGGSVTDTTETASTSRMYLDSEDAKYSVWVADGSANGQLALYNIATGKDQDTTKTKGQYKPLRWLNNRVFVYREATKTGGTDYVYSLDGGEAIKIADTASF